MSRKLLLLATCVAALSGSATFAQAADIIDPPVVELPEPMAPAEPVSSGGWYLRGDIGYAHNRIGTIDYFTSGGGLIGSGTLTGSVSSNYSGGVGIGYDTGNYLRTDLTVDYFSKSNFLGSSTGTCTPVGGGAPIACTTTDTANFGALSLMANAYIDLGKFNGFTPYVGVGIGGSHVTWSTLTNDFNNVLVTNADELHAGAKNWRFTYALMAGASYDVSDCVALDAGYRYRNIQGGKMFGVGTAGTTGPGYDRSLQAHEFRVGARFKLAGLGGSGCGGGSHVPDYQPVYK